MREEERKNEMAPQPPLSQKFEGVQKGAGRGGQKAIPSKAKKKKAADTKGKREKSERRRSEQPAPSSDPTLRFRKSHSIIRRK
jgi:hypothetical protein